MGTEQRYIYGKISRYGQVRLLRLSPGDLATDKVECTLETVEFTSLEAKASTYRALSYTWGSPNVTRTIYVNGKTIEVRRNLFDFLQWLRRNPRNQDAIWIDQLCINQADESERSDQVQQMRNIYEMAVEVLAWIGHLKQQLSPAATSSKKTSVTVNDQSGQSVAIEKHVDHILASTYFTRLWIIQELVLATRIMIIFDNQEIPWAALVQLVAPQMFPCSDFDLDEYMRNSESIIVKVQAARLKEPRFIDAINAFCAQQCTDPRDKIIGLSGLLSRTEAIEASLISLRYMMPVRRVFDFFCQDHFASMSEGGEDHAILLKLRREMGLQKSTMPKCRQKRYSLQDVQIQLRRKDCLLSDVPDGKTSLVEKGAAS